MKSNQVKYFSIIFSVLSCAGAESSGEFDGNFTMTTVTETEINAVTVTHTTATSSPPPEKRTLLTIWDETGFSGPTTKSAEENKVSQTTEFPAGSRGNETASYSDDTFFGNGTAIPETLALDHSECIDLGIRETAGLVAIGFLVFSVMGYVGFVLWRRYLQNKYGNGQTLITEDIYDISDLRHFEI